MNLRDLAALLRGTPAQFNVAYDAARNAVVVTKGQPYAGEAGALSSVSALPVAYYECDLAVLYLSRTLCVDEGLQVGPAAARKHSDPDFFTHI